jgi:hypothetical protein
VRAIEEFVVIMMLILVGGVSGWVGERRTARISEADFCFGGPESFLPSFFELTTWQRQQQQQTSTSSHGESQT